MMTTLFRSLCLLPKTMYTVSNDNLSLAIFGRISKWIQMPLCKLISGLLSISFALLFDLRQLMEFISTGILLAYTMIAIGVLVVRYVPDVHLSDEIGTDSNLFSPSIAETNSSNHSDLTSSNFKVSILNAFSFRNAFRTLYAQFDYFFFISTDK
jgi:amino acid transporter